MRDAIEIREYERKQLEQFLPELVKLYTEKEMGERATALNELIPFFVEPHEDNESEMYELGSDIWDELVTALNELDDQRASWLAAKIARRAELKTYQMGFTTNVPLMSLVTGIKPERPG